MSAVRSFIYPLLLWVVSALSIGGSVAAQEQNAKVVTERVTTVRETTTTTARQVREEPALRRAAIFVRNRARPELDGKVGVLEELITSRVTGEEDFTVISRENVINSVKAFSSEGASAGFEVKPEQDLDRLLSNRTSALRLGQLMQADYLLIVSITTFSQNTRSIAAYGLNQRVREERMRLSYQILDTSLGGTLAAETITADKSTRLSDGLEHEPDQLDDLLDDAAGKLAAGFVRQVRKGLRRKPDDRPLAEVTVVCTIEDLTIPDVVRDASGEWVVAKQRGTMEVMDVDIELNGVVEGSAPGTVRLQPGLNTIRLARAGFRPWERTINVRDGMNLAVALQMTDENRRRMREDMAFFEQLRIDQKLTDAQVKVLEGRAQMLRQSGYRIDIKQDVKIDTDQAPKFEKHVQSFWSN